MEQVIWVFSFLVLWCNHFNADYSLYYQWINEAERAVIEKDLPLSIEKYQMAFSQFDPFARDCWNAIEVAHQTGDQKALVSFSQLGLENGIPFTSLMKALGEDHLLFSTIDSVFVEQGLVEYQGSLDLAIKDTLVQFFIEDQALRKKTYNTPFWRRKKAMKTWNSRTQQQVAWIESQLIKPGVGERQVGISTSTDHPKLSEKHLSNGALAVLLIHHFSERVYFNKSLYERAFRSGNLSRYTYATVLDFVAKFGEENSGSFITTRMQKSQLATDIQNMNLRRIKLGLLPLEGVEQLRELGWFTVWEDRLY